MEEKPPQMCNLRPGHSLETGRKVGTSLWWKKKKGEGETKTETSTGEKYTEESGTVLSNLINQPNPRPIWLTQKGGKKKKKQLKKVCGTRGEGVDMKFQEGTEGNTWGAITKEKAPYLSKRGGNFTREASCGGG